MTGANERTRRLRVRLISSMKVGSVLLLGACGWADNPDGGALDDAISIALEAVEVPETFLITSAAEVDADGGAEGLWAAVPDLIRPEEGRVRVIRTGRSLDVALYRSTGQVVISAQAAEVLGLVRDGSDEVSIVALRREPRLIAP